MNLCSQTIRGRLLLTAPLDQCQISIMGNQNINHLFQSNSFNEMSASISVGIMKANMFPVAAVGINVTLNKQFLNKYVSSVGPEALCWVALQRLCLSFLLACQ